MCATEVPLLYEVGGEDRFDAVVVVTAPPKVRGARSEVAAEQREPRLLPDSVKIAQADFAYVNDGSLEKLDDFVQAVLRELTRVKKLLALVLVGAALGGLRVRALDRARLVRAPALPAALRRRSSAATRATTGSTRRCSPA